MKAHRSKEAIEVMESKSGNDALKKFLKSDDNSVVIELPNGKKFKISRTRDRTSIRIN